MAPHLRGLVVALVVLAVTLVALWAAFCHSSNGKLEIEKFDAPQFPNGLIQTLGATATELFDGADSSVAGIVSMANDLTYSPFNAAFYLDVVSSNDKMLRLLEPDTLVARNALMNQTFMIFPSDEDVRKSKTVRNIRVYRLMLPDEVDTQAFVVKHASDANTIDFSLWKGRHPPPITFSGIRLGFNLGEQRSHEFYTPEVLKRRILAGVTMVVPHNRKGIVAFRRFRDTSGYILFAVEAREREVVVRHAVFRVSRPPTQLANAVAALSWNENGEYDESAGFESTPNLPGAISQAETMSVDEMSRAMDVATSITIPLRRRNATIVEITPGTVRVTSHPVADGAESKLVRVPPFMSSERRRWTPDPSRPLQMYTENAICFPVPSGDHIHLSKLIMQPRGRKRALAGAESQS